MNVDPIIFFDLVIALFILSLALVIVVIYLSKTMKKLHFYLIEQEHLKADIAKNNMALLDETRNRAVKIIEDANLFSQDTKESFNKQLTSATSDFVKLYGNALNDLKAKNIEIFQNISKNIEISTLSEIKKFKEIIEQETIDSEKMVKQKVEHEYNLTKKSIGDYKEAQIKKIDAEITAIIQRVSEIVLGKAISLTDHEQLIINALEEAKKEGVFKDEE